MNTSISFLRMFPALPLNPSLVLKLVGASVKEASIDLNASYAYLCINLQNPLTEDDYQTLRESIQRVYSFTKVEFKIKNKEEIAMRLNITSGVVHRAQKVVIYGPEGIGKSTLASKFPEPLFIDTEAGTQHMDVRRTDAPSSWTMLMETIRAVRDTPGVCKTLVLDTADWAEMLCISHITSSAQVDSIEAFAYGKGYVYLQEEFGRLLNLMSEVVDRGIHVVITAHAKMRKFEQPDEMGAYDRWEMKLSKQVGPLLKEWCDLLLFANYKTLVVATDVDRKGKARNHKGQGGKRVMYTSHHPCWDAKNRMNLPDELPLDYTPLAQYFDIGIPTSTTVVPAPENPAPQTQPSAEATPAQKVADHDMYFYHPESDAYWMLHQGEPFPDLQVFGTSEEIEKERYDAGIAAGTEPHQNPMLETHPPVSSPQSDSSAVQPEDVIPAGTAQAGVTGSGPAQNAESKLRECKSDFNVRIDLDSGKYIGANGQPLKDALQEFYPLMEADDFTSYEVQSAIAFKGYFPADTPLENLPDDFIRGVLIGAWDQVKAVIENDIREDSDLPF